MAPHQCVLASRETRDLVGRTYNWTIIDPLSAATTLPGSAKSYGFVGRRRERKGGTRCTANESWVGILNQGEEVIWWSISSDVAKELEAEVSRYLPEKVVQSKRSKLVF